MPARDLSRPFLIRIWSGIVSRMSAGRCRMHSRFVHRTPGNRGRAKEKPSQKMIEVPYTAFEGSSRRVIIPVQLNGSITAKMALDTGSPGMIIFDRLANRLGLFEKDDGKLLTYSAGIGGETPSILTIIDSVQGP